MEEIREIEAEDSRRIGETGLVTGGTEVMLKEGNRKADATVRL